MNLLPRTLGSSERQMALPLDLHWAPKVVPSIEDHFARHPTPPPSENLTHLWGPRLERPLYQNVLEFFHSFVSLALQKHNTVFSSRFNQAYWCCPLTGAVCCTGSTGCCSSKYPVCCGATNSCCYVEYPVCCFPGTSRAYCCAASSPVCLGESKCGSLDPDVEPVEGKKSNRR